MWSTPMALAFSTLSAPPPLVTAVTLPPALPCGKGPLQGELVYGLMTIFTPPCPRRHPVAMRVGVRTLDKDDDF